MLRTLVQLLLKPLVVLALLLLPGLFQQPLHHFLVRQGLAPMGFQRGELRPALLQSLLLLCAGAADLADKTLPGLHLGGRTSRSGRRW